jgi:rhodanese-related sulfurtransferase
MSKVRPHTLHAMLKEAEAAVPRLAPHEAASWQAAGGLVVDVREARELAGGMVAGALHVPRGMLEFCADPDSAFYLDPFRRDRPVVVYCGIGERSALAAKTLLDMGYHRVANLPSFDDWVLAGLPVMPPPPDE